MCYGMNHLIQLILQATRSPKATLLALDLEFPATRFLPAAQIVGWRW